MSTVTRWWWIRHAPVPDGRNIVYGQGDLDADCTDAAGFQALAETLPAGAVLVTSDLKRAIQTADAIRAAGLSLPAPILESALREQSFGDWQGLTHDEFAALRDSSPHPHWRQPAFVRAPGGESFADLVSRVVPAVIRLSEDHAGRDIIAVAHGGTIRAALALALGLNPERALAFSAVHLGVTQLDYITGLTEGEAWRVSGVNRPAR
ncbi:MAG: histidine phosphatase family protein [Proteobacteria bacterium]|nr:histidine phosphatase family protein [Pseudomonadota bacterium]